MATTNTSYPSELVWAAAAAAFRINGKYVSSKSIPYFQNEGEGPAITNKSLLSDLLTETSRITDEDYKTGEAMRNFYRGMTFKIISGRKLTDYDKKIINLLDEETISTRDFGLLASVPKAYSRELDKERVAKVLSKTEGFAGSVGSSVELNISVVSCYFTLRYDAYHITAISSSNQRIDFFHSKELKGDLTIKGTVKLHGTFHTYGEYTRLNRVKVI